MKLALILLSFLSFAASTYADNHSDELNPFAPDIDSVLRDLDKSFGDMFSDSFEWNDSKNQEETCFQFGCKIYIDAQKSIQEATLYVDGKVHLTFKISSGGPGHSTPSFDTHPNGRIYDRYSSSKFPGGDYNGLGNMPYAVFIKGGFALHGTPKSNWSKLGTAASHGCIRMHPENAKIFNELVRLHGVKETWVTVRQ
jgi:hypothetical protein